MKKFALGLISLILVTAQATQACEYNTVCPTQHPGASAWCRTHNQFEVCYPLRGGYKRSSYGRNDRRGDAPLFSFSYKRVDYVPEPVYIPVPVVPQQAPEQQYAPPPPPAPAQDPNAPSYIGNITPSDERAEAIPWIENGLIAGADLFVRQKGVTDDPKNDLYRWDMVSPEGRINITPEIWESLKKFPGKENLEFGCRPQIATHNGSAKKQSTGSYQPDWSIMDNSDPTGFRCVRSYAPSKK